MSVSVAGLRIRLNDVAVGPNPGLRSRLNDVAVGPNPGLRSRLNVAAVGPNPDLSSRLDLCTHHTRHPDNVRTSQRRCLMIFPQDKNYGLRESSTSGDNRGGRLPLSNDTSGQGAKLFSNKRCLIYKYEISLIKVCNKKLYLPPLFYFRREYSYLIIHRRV